MDLPHSVKRTTASQLVTTPMEHNPTASSTNMFSKVVQAPPDAIFGVKGRFVKDPNPKKVLLGVGAYRDDNGNPWVLPVVRKASQQIIDANEDWEYLPIDGHPKFRELTSKFIFGEASPVIVSNQVATCQTLSGTNALRIAAQFIAKYLPGPKNTAYFSSPTWGNHQAIFQKAGMKTENYPYYHAKSRGLDLAGYLNFINTTDPGSVFVLHTCAHNPTGVDPTFAEWDKIIDALLYRNHFVLFDTAYQGFATGNFENDVYAVRAMAKKGAQFMVTQSYAKNLGIYSGRLGALNVVCNSTTVRDAVQSQLKKIIRPMFSNPPKFGALIAIRVLSDPEMKAEWFEQVKTMSNRIKASRQALFDELITLKTPGSWTHVVKQIGMFCFTGLTKNQVDYMEKNWSIYMLGNGRISIAGLNTKNVSYVAKAINDAVLNCAE